MFDRQEHHPRRTDTYLVIHHRGDPSWVSVGRHTYGHPSIQEHGAAPLKIGKYCSIADEVVFIMANHRIDFITTYPFSSLSSLWNGASGASQDHEAKTGITIGNDVWIGFRSTILPGTIIGDGAVIAAGSVVRGIVPPYTIYGGVPARCIRKRFEDNIISELLKIKWWDWEDDFVNEHCNDLLSGDIEKFIEKFKK